MGARQREYPPLGRRPTTMGLWPRLLVGRPVGGRVALQVSRARWAGGSKRGPNGSEATAELESGGGQADSGGLFVCGAGQWAATRPLDGRVDGSWACHSHGRTGGAASRWRIDPGRLIGPRGEEESLEERVNRGKRESRCAARLRPSSTRRQKRKLGRSRDQQLGGSNQSTPGWHR